MSFRRVTFTPSEATSSAPISFRSQRPLTSAPSVRPARFARTKSWPVASADHRPENKKKTKQRRILVVLMDWSVQEPFEMFNYSLTPLHPPSSYGRPLTLLDVMERVRRDLPPPCPFSVTSPTAQSFPTPFPASPTFHFVSSPPSPLRWQFPSSNNTPKWGAKPAR